MVAIDNSQLNIGTTSDKIPVLTADGGLDLPGTLKSGRYRLADDMLFQPIVDGQSGIGAYWGIQIGGLRTGEQNSATPFANVGARNEFCVVVAPCKVRVDNNNTPDSFTVLGMVKRSYQTGGYFFRCASEATNGTLTDVASLDIQGNLAVKSVKVELAAAPAAGDPGTAGEIRVSENFISVCIATNTWKRVGISLIT